jgi:hypothetical protein
MPFRTIKSRLRSTTEAQIGQGKGRIGPFFWHFYSYLGFFG